MRNEVLGCFACCGAMSLLSRRKLTPRWSFETRDEQTIIWKLLVSSAGILVGEERNVEAKQGSLFAINIKTGVTLWRDTVLPEPWWFGIEKATKDTLFVQTFRSPNLPEPKGIIALDITTGALRWQDADVAYLFLAEGKVYAIRQGFSHREYLTLFPDTGAIIDNFGSDSAPVEIARGLIDEHDPFTHFAERVRSGEPFQSACRLIDTVSSADELRGAIESLERGSYRVLAYHRRAEGAQARLQNVLRSELAVFDRERVVFQETLAKETPLALPDNFFLSHDHLLYVKDKRVLTAVALS